MNIFNLFIRKTKQNVFNVKNVTLTVTAGSWCPKCKDDGALFHYNNEHLKGYLCENCCKSYSDEEYNRLLNITQRKQKLDLINEFNDRVF